MKIIRKNFTLNSCSTTHAHSIMIQLGINLQTRSFLININNKEKIWQIVHRIPSGKVASYGQIAKLAGLPGYGRYVGYTMKTLPTSTKLPWYRVVNSQGSISFKKGTKQYLLQKSLLEKEGIVFIKGKFPMSKFGWAQGAE